MVRFPGRDSVEYLHPGTTLQIRKNVDRNRGSDRNARIQVQLVVRDSVEIGLEVHPLPLAIDGSAGENVRTAARVRLVVDAGHLKVTSMIRSSIVLLPARPRIHEGHKPEEEDGDEDERAERDPKPKNSK